MSRSLPLALALFLLAPVAHAATLTVAAPTGALSAGTPFTISVGFAADGAAVNAVDGGITIPAGVSVVSVATGDSLMTLWPVGPLYVASDREVEFTGGVPGGLAANASGPLFTLTAVATNPGSYTFSSTDAHAYKNDGKGTLLALAPAHATLAVGAQGTAAAATPADTTAPVFTAAAIGRDPSLFDNQYFATFFATDAGSGIDHYTVAEGYWGKQVAADRYYVLADQSLDKVIIIRAYDKAGNSARYVIPAEHPRSYALLYAVIALILLVLLASYFVRRRRR